MLLTITYTGKDTENLGYLLYKNPYRPQVFEMSYGKAYVFYPEISDERTTAALLLDIDPIDLARGKAGTSGGGLFDYVNDRPYVSSSFMSTAISKVFGTAMTGRADAHQELSDSPLDLEAAITMLPCRGARDKLTTVFEPLGYSVSYESFVLDEAFPGWGESSYVNLTICGKIRLRDLLKHLFVLIPVFDRQKHYWIGSDEVEKLLRLGEDWLPEHPEKEYITGRYLNRRRSLVNMAFDRLAASDAVSDSANDMTGDEASDTADNGPLTLENDEKSDAGESEDISETGKSESADETEGVEKVGNSEEMEKVYESKVVEKADKPENAEQKMSLKTQRLGSVVAALKSSGVKSVIDIGCGEGSLLRLLVNERQFTKITGVDVSAVALERASSKLKLDRRGTNGDGRVELFQSSLIYRDTRFSGYDAACVIEVIEHLDAPRLSAFERVLFEFARPPLIVLTTPNKEYNANYAFLHDDDLRHGDHRFEWTRAEFREWAAKTAERFGYTVQFSEVGEADETHGAPTQQGVFRLEQVQTEDKG